MFQRRGFRQSCKFEVARKFKVASSKLEVQSCRFKVKCSKLQVQSCKSKVEYSKLISQS